MNYSLSQEILDRIKISKKILINCHRSPDPDSIGSALAAYMVLKQLGLEAAIVCSDNIPSSSKFLPFSEKIQKISFEKFDFSKFDLFLILDSASFDMVTGNPKIRMPNISTIAIDHHKTNTNFGEINLIDSRVSSCAELLYKIFEDWDIRLDGRLATTLLTGVLGDTGVFEYPGVSTETLDVAKNLMKLGADKDDIILHIFKSINFKKVKFWGEIIKRMEVDEEYHFVWSAVPYEIYSEYGRPGSAKETAASMFLTLVDGTDFGMIMVEEDKNNLPISFRARTDFDVSVLAIALGGGGHRAAAGATIYNLGFDKAVLKVLETARKYAKKTNKRSQK